MYTSDMSQQSTQHFALSVTRAIGSPSSIILHTLLFILSFVAAIIGWIAWDNMLLILTTIVSLEAIYLAIFIQMTINIQSKSIEAVEKDIDEIQKDVEEISEDVEEIQEDVEEIQEEDEEEDKCEDNVMLTRIEGTLAELIKEIADLKKEQKKKSK